MTKKEIPLQAKLREEMSKTGISVHALEKQAGLKRSAIQNILYGKSKKPSAEILAAITKVLGCSIDDLMGRSAETPLPTNYLVPTTVDASILDGELYTKSVHIANKLFEKYHIQPTKQEALNFIDEIYQYSASNKLTEIDLSFATWLIKRCWHVNDK